MLQTQTTQTLVKLVSTIKLENVFIFFFTWKKNSLQSFQRNNKQKKRRKENLTVLEKYFYQRDIF